MNDASIKFFANYNTLCQSPLRDAEMNRADATSLLAHSMITHVGFASLLGNSMDTLVLSTRPVIITDKRSTTQHLIGEWLIYLIRKRTGRWWDARFHLYNPDGLRNHSGELHRMHPHMTCMTVNYLAHPVASLCITAGHFHIYQHIRKGELYAATTLLVDLLHHVQPGREFPDAELELWPTITASSEA